MCDLCGKKGKEYYCTYKLCDDSEVYICQECAEKLYGKNIEPIVNSRLFHIIALMEYIEHYEQIKKQEEKQNV